MIFNEMLDGFLEIMQALPPSAKMIVDTTAIMAVLTSWAQFAQAGLTIVSTLAGLVWILIRIWETETVKHWREKRKNNG